MAKNKNNGWQLLGDGPEAYERYIVPAFSGAWAQDMVARAELQKEERILDLGCGTGIVARWRTFLLAGLQLRHLPKKYYRYPKTSVKRCFRQSYSPSRIK